MEYSEVTELFTQNYETIRKRFIGEYNAMDAISAVMCVAEEKVLTPDQINEAKDILKHSKGIFSVFRDDMRIPMVIKMALSGDPQAYLDGVSEVYSRIQNYFTFGSEQALMAAIIIYDNAPEEIVYRMPEETYQVYRMMRQDHPFLTDKSDLALAAFIAMKGGNYNEIFDYIEECHEILTKRFFISRDAVQSVAQVFALDMSRSPEEKCAQFNEYYDILKHNRLKVTTGPQLAILGFLINMNLNIDEIMEYLDKYEDFLKKHHGLGALGTETQARRVIAAALYMIEKYSDSGMNNRVLSAILNLIIEFEIILMIIIISATVHSSSQINQ